MYKKGEIHLVNFGDKSVTGYCEAGIRPSIVLKEIDPFKVLVIPFTTKNLDKIYWSEMLFTAGEGNLFKDSKLLVSQFQNISIDKVGSYIGKVPNDRLESIDLLFRKVVSIQ